MCTQLTSHPMVMGKNTVCVCQGGARKFLETMLLLLVQTTFHMIFSEFWLSWLLYEVTIYYLKWSIGLCLGHIMTVQRCQHCGDEAGKVPPSGAVNKLFTGCSEHMLAYLVKKQTVVLTVPAPCPGTSLHY